MEDINKNVVRLPKNTDIAYLLEAAPTTRQNSEESRHCKMSLALRINHTWS